MQMMFVSIYAVFTSSIKNFTYPKLTSISKNSPYAKEWLIVEFQLLKLQFKAYI
jgi:hypothetical protein